MWWAVLLVGLFLIAGGLGWAYIPAHRHPFPHFAQSTGRFNEIVVAGIGLVLCVISLFISPWWVLLMYVGVIGGAASRTGVTFVSRRNVCKSTLATAVEPSPVA